MLPNLLTLSRLALTPLFCFYVLKGAPLGLAVALLIAIIAFITDMLDGFLARRWECASIFGACFDPIADKIFVLSAFVSLLSYYGQLQVSLLALIVIIVRELAVTGLRIVLLAKENRLLTAERFGKLKTAIQFAWIVASVFVFWLASAGFPVGGVVPWMDVFLWGVAFYTLVSGLIYAWANRQALIASWEKMGD